jgi:predicted nucleic acid-binding protein
VLAEFANAMSQPNHGRVLTVLAMLRNRGDFEIVMDSDRLFDSGLTRYEQRADKGWSLTDCISFVLMEQRGIAEALTGDHHFEQAGFVALLK